ncbi:cupin domain-containing protein [Algoriphagus sp.]|uniref:cupin domain-containing protein n=1 Tax=Algoriphagus sp. TaxID=1872435 RepID=UPI00327CCDAD
MALLLSFGANAQYSDNLLVEELLSADRNSIGQKIDFPNVDNAQVSMRKITFPAGSSTGWHTHEIPVFSYVISGTLTVEIEGMEPTEYSTGQCFAESFGTYHQGVNKTDQDLIVLAVYLGGDDKPLSINKPDR